MLGRYHRGCGVARELDAYIPMPMLLMLACMFGSVKASRPSFLTLSLFYLLLVISVMSPIELVLSADWFDRSMFKGIFDCLRISPEVIELNLILRLRYNFLGGLWRSEVTNSPVWIPVENTLNFVQALLHYFFTSQYGPMEWT